MSSTILDAQPVSRLQHCYYNSESRLRGLSRSLSARMIERQRKLMASIGILSYLRCQCQAYSAPVAERSSPGDNRREIETLGSATMTLQVHHLMSGPIHPPRFARLIRSTEYS